MCISTLFFPLMFKVLLEGATAISGTQIVYCIPEVIVYEEYPDVVSAQISSLDDEHP